MSRPIGFGSRPPVWEMLHLTLCRHHDWIQDTVSWSALAASWSVVTVIWSAPSMTGSATTVAWSTSREEVEEHQIHHRWRGGSPIHCRWGGRVRSTVSVKKEASAAHMSVMQGAPCGRCKPWLMEEEVQAMAHGGGGEEHVGVGGREECTRVGENGVLGCGRERERKKEGEALDWREKAAPNPNFMYIYNDGYRASPRLVRPQPFTETGLIVCLPPKINLRRRSF